MGQIKNIKLHIVTDIKNKKKKKMSCLIRSSLARNIGRTFTTSTKHRTLEQAPIKVYGVEGRYAHALFSAALKTNALESAERELNAVQELMDEQTSLADYCADPTINKFEKRDVMCDVLKAGQFSDLTVNFMSVVAEENRLKRSKGIIQAFNKIMRARRGEVECTITTAKPLEASTSTQVTEILHKFIEPTQTLQMQTHTDPTLIGGMVINIGEYYIDMSTATKVKRITQALKGQH